MNKEKALEYISDKQYENVPKEFYKDKSFVLEMVNIDGFALEYADESFRKDKSIVLEAVKTNEFALQYADESLQKDPDIIKAAKK
jgi:hypothetical protein